MNKNDSAAGPPPSVPPEIVGKNGPLAEATQGRDPTLKWCVPDLAGNPALPPTPQPPTSYPAVSENNLANHKTSSFPEAPAGSAIRGALPEAIQESARDASSPRSESIEIILADGPAEAGELEPLARPEAPAGVTSPPKVAMEAVTPPPRPAMEPVTPPPKAAMEAVTPPPKPAMEPVTPPPRPAMEPVTPPPRPAMEPVIPPPKAAMEPVTPPPRPAMEPVTPPPRPAMEPVIPPPKAAMEPVTPPPKPEAVLTPAPPAQVPASLPRPSPQGGLLAAPGAGAARPALQVGSTTGALPEAPIRTAETAEVGDADFEVMEPGEPASSAAPAPPPVPGIPGAPATTSQGLRPESASDTGGSVGAAAALAREALSLPEALSRRPLKKRLKPWFEEVFDENYLRTLPFMTAQQTLRETAFIEEALSSPPDGELLDIGCGYGRHAIELGQRGFRVTGLDLSLPLLIRAADEAQRRGLSVNFVHADMREMTYDSQFAAAYCVLTSFGYFDEETNLRVASSICRALKPGGRFLVEAINRDYIVSDLPSRVWWEGDGCVVLEEVDFDFHTSRVLIRRSIVFVDGRQVENEISIRAYSLHELGRVLRRAGFQVVDVSGSLTAKEPFLGAASRHVVIVCERPMT
jgi:SAM-dependent methyltransferase